MRISDRSSDVCSSDLDASNLTGAKYGCGTGDCGACTVDIDGAAVRACQVTIGEIEGAFVTTIEGLSGDQDHPLQLAFIDANVPQCGFCIPGDRKSVV